MINNFTYTDKPSEGIVEIPIGLLVHHPDNPRKDLGDLSELTESIKARGVLQNLTVVPAKEQGGVGVYHVVIGNRRLEASKAAGQIFHSTYKGEYPKHSPNRLLELLYTWLCSIGYQMSDDERMMMDGMHPLFEGNGDKDSITTFHPDGHTVHDFDYRFQCEDEGLLPTDRAFRWSMLDAVQLKINF